MIIVGNDQVRASKRLSSESLNSIRLNTYLADVMVSGASAMSASFLISSPTIPFHPIPAFESSAPYLLSFTSCSV